MQYGNDRHKIEVMVDAKGLNRTMQYGNYFCWENYIVGFKLFKSYYVVWKLKYLKLNQNEE